jgi:HPt (histidine-containing phosphotransfer) domain-containing protein
MGNTGAKDTARKHQTPVDIRVLERIVGADPSVVHMVLQEFLHTATATFERLHTADGGSTIMHQQAHRLKSSARSVGAQRLGELCQALEDVGRADDVQRLSPLLTELKIEWQAVEQFIHRYMDSIA